MENNNTRCEIIDWRITSKCNNNCLFCYASDKIPSADLNTKRIITKKIIQSGCKAVCISGGEPLLDEDVVNVIEELFRNHIEVYLSTNGSVYMKHREKLEPMLSKLSLSLDGYDCDSQSINGRKADSFNDVIKILDYYKTHSHRFTIKIGTLLSNKNMIIEHFEKMFNLLCEYQIDLWKVYEFIPEGRGLENREEYILERDAKNEFFKQFYELQVKIQESYKFQCSLITREMRDAAYFIIRPDGKVIIPFDSSEGLTEEVIGDLVTQPIDEVLLAWNKRVNNIKYNTNIDSRSITRAIPRNSIDDIDKKILYLLDQNPLQDESQIKESLKSIFNISIGKDIISAKIRALFENHALYRIMPVVNVANFGLNVFLVNLYIKHSNYMDAEKIGQSLTYKPFIAWVVQCKEYNANDDFLIFRIAIFAKDVRSLKYYEKELRNDFGVLLHSMDTDLVPDKYILSQNYLLERFGEKLTFQSETNSHIELDTTDEKLSADEFKVLKAMSSIDHLTIANIASTTRFSSKKVHDIINNLLSKQIINKFDVVLDANVLGIYHYLILVKFEKDSTKLEFEQYIKKMPNATHINTLIMGTWDMDFEIRVNQVSTWADIWADIEDKFGSLIVEKKLIRIEKEYNFKFLIDVTLEAMQKSVTSPSLDVSQNRKAIEGRLRRK